MNKLVELYVREINRPDGEITIQDVPVRLRTQVAEAIAELSAEAKTEDAPVE